MTPTQTPPMFAGLARPHRIRDFAAIALCLSFIGGFMAHAVSPTRAAPTRQDSMLASTTALPSNCACPDVRIR